MAIGDFLGDVVSLPFAITKQVVKLGTKALTYPGRQVEQDIRRQAQETARKRKRIEDEQKKREEMARAAADRERRGLLLRGGRASTMFTPPGGLQMLAPVERRTLGG